MNITLSIVYDNNDNFIVNDEDGEPVWEYGDTPSGEIATVRIVLDLPPPVVKTATVVIPQRALDNDSLISTVTIE